jgi:hypothetical protein
MQDPSRSHRIRRWIYPGQDKLSLLSPWVAIHLAAVAVAGLVLRQALSAPGSQAVLWLIGSMIAGGVSCLWTILYAVFSSSRPKPRILFFPLLFAIAQGCTLVIGWSLI